MSSDNSEFLIRYRGYFKNLLKWADLEAFWQTLRRHADQGWYIYAVGEAPPQQPSDSEQLEKFIQHIDTLLHSEHDEDYCGIVYVDDPEAPTLVKIYDPNNLGSVCGPGLGPPPLPGWVISQLPPDDLNAAFPPPANRRRWWQKLFG
ncbi:MAG: hypothetical protein ACQETD_04750 [Pseudomonadota bacterium]